MHAQEVCVSVTLLSEIIHMQYVFSTDSLDVRGNDVIAKLEGEHFRLIFLK